MNHLQKVFWMAADYNGGPKRASARPGRLNAPKSPNCATGGRADAPGGIYILTGAETPIIARPFAST
jgi:hypothetical protein